MSILAPKDDVSWKEDVNIKFEKLVSREAERSQKETL